MHLPVPFEVWLIFHSPYKIAQYMSETLLMVGAVSIIRFVMVMYDDTFKVLNRSFGKSIVALMIHMLVYQYEGGKWLMSDSISKKEDMIFII